jgi:hypothetical protein
MAENLWRRRPLTENPYDWTAFQIVDLSPDVVGRRAINATVANARKVLQALPGQRRIAGKAIDQADLTAASQILTDPNKRLIEELLEHHPEEPQTAELQRFQSILTLTDATASNALPIRHLRFLQLLILSLLEAATAQLPPVHLPLPTEDPTHVPPFRQGDY